MTEVILEVRGLDALAVRAYLNALGGRDRTPRRMAGRGWTAVIAEEPIQVGPFQVDRVLLHILGAERPVDQVVGSLQDLAISLNQ